MRTNPNVGGEISPQQWWIDTQTDAAIKQIRATQEVDRKRLEFQQSRFNDVLAMYKTAFGAAGTGGSSTIPSQFNEMVNLYQPGGQFGAGGKAEVAKAGQEALAAGQIGLASTGMSSGTNVAGLGARIYADTGLANKKIEDERVALLGGALGQAGSAQLTADQLRAQREAALLNSLSSFSRV